MLLCASSYRLTAYKFRKYIYYVSSVEFCGMLRMRRVSYYKVSVSSNYAHNEDDKSVRKFGNLLVELCYSYITDTKFNFTMVQS